MFEYFFGKVQGIRSDALILEVNQIGYHILMANPYRYSDSIGEEVKIWLYLAASQDSIRLYGFASQSEKQLFLHLISVSGIGPKSALSILSLGDNQGLVEAIEGGDVKFLTKFPGVGKKTAQQMILDLQGKLVGDENLETSSGKGKTERPAFLDELEDALSSLGYSQREIDRIMKNADFSGVDNTADAIRVALHFLTES